MSTPRPGQSVYLEATSLDLGCYGLVAFRDAAVVGLLGADGEAERSVLLLTVGRRAQV